ncbi:Eukaryotic translation initiation factor 5A-1, partial [Perkinsus olseni]
TEGFGGVARTGKKDKAERQREKAERQRKEAAGDDADDDVVVKEKKEKKEKEKKHKKDKGEDDTEKKEKKEKKDKSEKKHHKHHKHEEDDSEEGGASSSKKSSKKKHSKKQASGDDESPKTNGDAADEKADKSTQEMDLAPLTSQSPELQEAVLEPLAAAMKDAGGIPSMPVDDFLQELRLLQISQRFSHVTRLYVALEVIFSEEKEGLCKNTFEARLPYVSRVIDNAGLTTAEVCEAFEVMYLLHPDVAKIAHYPYILKDLYDENLVTEGALLKHYEGSSSRKGFPLCRKAATPFLDWLRTAEAEDSSSSDEDDDSDDDEEEEVVTKKAPESKQKEAAKVSDASVYRGLMILLWFNAQARVAEEDDGSDIDVDAI